MGAGKGYRVRLAALCGIGLLASAAGLAKSADQTRPTPAHAKRTQAHPSPTRPTSIANHHKVHKAVAVTPVPEPVVEVAPPPPLPLTPGQMPPNPPSVTYADGQLTIVAENSRMADILSAVRTQTGAAMDIPPGGGTERVWAQFGPGPARAVLAALLGGTDFDYVIQAADADPARIQSVMLTARTKGIHTGDTSPTPASYANRWQNRIHSNNTPGLEPRDSDNAATDSSADQDSTSASQASAAAAPADSQPSSDPTASASSSPSSSSSTDTPSASLSAKLPLSVTEAEAHPAPMPNSEQAIPQMQNLFELRKQLQEQENAQQKAGLSR